MAAPPIRRIAIGLAAVGAILLVVVSVRHSPFGNGPGQSSNRKSVFLPSNGPRMLVESRLITAIYEDSGPDIKLTLISPVGVNTQAEFDVNANGIIDPYLDVSYGPKQDGSSCPQYMISRDVFTACGQFRSDARLTHSTADNKTRDVWLIPKSEISNHRGNFALVVLDITDLRSTPGQRIAIPSHPFLAPFVLAWKDRNSPVT
jgi:hypothetical protein